MKTKLFKTLLVAVGLLVTSLTTQTWGADASSATIIYDNTASQWSNVQLMIGHSTWSSVYSMTNISNTNLYYLTSLTWGNYTEFYFVTGAAGWGDEGNSPTHRVAYVGGYSAKQTTNLGSSKYTFTSSGTDNGASLTSSTTTAYTGLNYTQTLNQTLSTDGGTTYSSSTLALATVEVSSYKLTSYTASTSSSGTISSGSSSTSCSAAKSAVVTYTISGVASGYSFVGWYDGTTQKSTSTTYTYNATAAKTITARFKAEETHDVVISYKYGSTTIKTGTTESAVGVTTSRSVTAPSITGYTFSNWTKGTGVNITSGTTSSSTISITTNSSGAYTLQANYTEDLSSPWHLLGASTPFGGWSSSNSNMLQKASGSSTGSVASITINVASLPSAEEYTFKLYNATTDKWRTNSGYWVTRANNNPTLNTEGGTNNELIFKPDIAGNYVFTLDYSSSNPVLTVTFPTRCTVTYSVSPSGAANAITTSPSVTSGGYVAAGTSVTFTHASAKAGYQWTRWENGSGTSLGTGDSYTATINSNTEVVAKYSARTYMVTLDQTGAGTTGSQTSVTATYNAAMPAISGSGKLPTAPNGYAFMGYYDALSPLGTKYYNSDGSSAHKWDKTSATTLYAYFKNAEVTAMTYKNNGTVVSPAVFAPNTSKITVTTTVSPTPVGSTHIDWRILHSNDNPIDPQPSLGTGTTTNQFTTPETSGMYKVEAVLRTGTTAGAGTTLHTMVTTFQVAGDHDVTVQYKCGDETIKASTTVTGKPLVWTSVTAPDIFGYTFSKWIPGDGISIRKGSTEDTVGVATTATIQIKAIYDGKLTAIYTQKNYVYFKNTLGWSGVYVNLLQSDYWGTGGDAGKGSGNTDRPNRNLQMTLVPGTTDIYYYEYGDKPISHFISFTQESMNGYDHFYQAAPNFAHVVYPSRYSDLFGSDRATEGGFYAATPMFVPLAGQDPVMQNDGRAAYYNSGYWTKYTPGTGYRLEIYYSDGSTKIRDIAFTSDDDLMPMRATANLEAGQTYKFQVKREGDVYYGNSGEMTYANHGQSIAWEMTNVGFSMCRITTNEAGDYTFKLSYSGNSSTPPEYRLRMAVDYPIANGDYRLIYKHTGQTNWKASAIVPKINNGKDTVSFFVKKAAAPILRIQKATVNASTGAITWKEYPTEGTQTNQITGSIASAITKDSVWNFNLSMNASGALSVTSAEPYTGNYYIRTDCANNKWDNYRGDPDHLMTYSEYSITHGGYSHYYCHWVQTDDRKNIKFTIANDYNPGLSDTLTRETASGEWANITYFVDEYGNIKRNANVRFMWNQSTNAIGRAYVDGAQEDGSRFLVITSEDGKIKKVDGSALSNNEVTFSDNENWIYEADVQAQPEAQFKLKSIWGESNVITQYFKGSSSATETLINGSGDTWYTIRLLYDFKTNRLVAAWVPADANITDDNPINADIMFIREHQGDIAQLTFGTNGKISKIETAYGVMRFNKYTLSNKDKSTHNPLSSPASIYERSLFFISFPFRVKLSEVFGFGTYGTHWAVQRYDGADRAARGHFLENGNFWRWMNRSTEYLEPNQGYLLAIDLDLLGEDADVWGPNSRSEQIELYFPSYGTMPDISKASVTQNIPEHICTINMHLTNPDLPDTGDPRTSYNRTIFDSHWNVLSVPTYVNTTSVSFANTTWTSAAKRGPKFLYTWNADDNTISATTASGYTYHAMHSYMAQYAGELTWTANSGSPSPIVARSTYEETPKEVEFRLELQQNEKMIDRTYVVLSEDEEVSAGFQFNEDMTKEFNASKANIYTFIPNEAIVAGNTLPMTDQTSIVPVGVSVVSDGEYVFTIPDGTNGVGVTLVDGVTGNRTNLALTDYQVSLEAGTYDGRFTLEISPIEQTTTDVEALNANSMPDGRTKKLIDGVLYIIKDGKVFDARGARIK